LPAVAVTALFRLCTTVFEDVDRHHHQPPACFGKFRRMAAYCTVLCLLDDLIIGAVLCAAILFVTNDDS
jgi:hypothetical protein